MEEARNVPTLSRRGEAFEQARRILYVEADGNPSTEDLRELLREHRDSVGRRDKSLNTPVPQFEIRSKIGVESQPDCEGANLLSEKGEALKMISYSMVYNAGGKGMAAFGHTMQKFEYCRGNQYFTFLFTSGPLKVSQVAEKVAHEYDVNVTDIKPAKQKGSVLFTWMLNQPQKEYERRLIEENRALYEVQFNLLPEEIYSALLFNVAHMNLQKETVLKSEPLPGYSAISNSCTFGFLETINYLIPGYTDNGTQILPKQLFKYAIHRKAKRVIVYPRAHK